MSKLGEIYYGIKNRIHNRKTGKVIDRIIQDFIAYSEKSDDPEVRAAGSYYRDGGKSPFPYEPSITFQEPEVLNDGFPYIFHKDKKLYFPKNYDRATIVRTYRGMVLEQDPVCPHCYTQNGFNVPQDGILVDLGCAEAMFSLDHVEHVAKLYLLETKSEWIDALLRTFEPWKDKVEIIHKYASNQSSETELCLDDLFQCESGKEIFVKMDIEGYEGKVIDGAGDFLKSNNKIQFAIATYHNQKDFDTFSIRYKQLDYSTQHTNGYILFFYDQQIQEPYLRRCLLQAKNYN